MTKIIDGREENNSPVKTFNELKIHGWFKDTVDGICCKL